MIRLYHAPASPFVRKVMVVLHETGLLERVETVPASGTAIAPASLPLVQNPLGKIPTLERDDGPALYDSRVICRYLDDLGRGGLYPAKPRLWEALTLEATGDGIAEAVLLMVYEGRVRPPEQQSGTWVEAQWQKVVRAADALEHRWLGYLAGPFDIGQIAVACGLGYADFRLGERDWRGGRPGLATWFERVGARPSLAGTRPQ